MIDLDARLTHAGADWRDGLDDDPSLDELFARRKPARRRVLPMLAAAVLVVALGVGAYGIARGRADLDRSAGSPYCQDHFTPGPTKFLRAADGSFHAQVQLRYDGDAPCLVNAYGPTAQLLDSSGTTIITGGNSLLYAVHPDQVRVTSGVTVTTMINWFSDCTPARSEAVTLRLFMGKDQRSHTRGVDIPIDVARPPACGQTVSTDDGLSVFGLSTVPAGLGSLDVSIYYSDGPPPGHGARRAGTVTASSNGRVVATARAGARQHAKTELPPGAYLLRTVSGDASCPDQKVTVPAQIDGTANIAVTCQVK